MPDPWDSPEGQTQYDPREEEIARLQDTIDKLRRKLDYSQRRITMDATTIQALLEERDDLREIVGVDGGSEHD